MIINFKALAQLAKENEHLQFMKDLKEKDPDEYEKLFGRSYIQVFTDKEIAERNARDQIALKKKLEFEWLYGFISYIFESIFIFFFSIAIIFYLMQFV